MGGETIAVSADVTNFEQVKDLTTGAIALTATFFHVYIFLHLLKITLTHRK